MFSGPIRGGTRCVADIQPIYMTGARLISTARVCIEEGKATSNGPTSRAMNTGKTTCPSPSLRALFPCSYGFAIAGAIRCWHP